MDNAIKITPNLLESSRQGGLSPRFLFKAKSPRRILISSIFFLLFLIARPSFADYVHSWCTYEPYNWYGTIRWIPTIHSDTWICRGYLGHGEAGPGWERGYAQIRCGELSSCLNVCQSQGNDWWEWRYTYEAGYRTQNCFDARQCRPTSVEEVCNNGIDDDCNGETDEGCAVCVDGDGDGNSAYDPVTCPGGNDCDDSDPFKNSHNYDNDGYSTCDGDCDEDPVTGPGTYPGANDICDGKDNNCNADTDEDCCEVDTVSVNPPWVWPKGTGGYTQAEVSVTLFRPAPPGGCTVDLIVEPVLTD